MKKAVKYVSVFNRITKNHHVELLLIAPNLHSGCFKFPSVVWAGAESFAPRGDGHK